MDLWPNYAFTPDGKAIVFSNEGKIVRLDVASGAMQEIPFTAHCEIAVAPRVAWQEKVETGPVQAKILRWPSQSPDGRWIAFEAFGRVWLQEIAGGKASGAPKRLTEGRRRASPPRVRADLLARRQVDRLRLLERRRGRPRLEGVRDAGRRADEADPDRRPLRQPGLVSQGRQDRARARLGPRVPRTPAGGGGVLRGRPARRGGRRPAPGPADQARQRDEVPSAGLLERRRHAALLPRSGRGQEADRRPQERPRLGPPGRHRPRGT